MALTGRRELFAHEYLKDLNATQAAIRAGYSTSDAAKEGHRLLADSAVQALVAALAAERNTELKIEARDVLLELQRLAMIDPMPLVNEHGCVRTLDELPIDVRRTIASLEVEQRWEGPRGEDKDCVVTTKVKFWNKNQALEALGRHLALFKDVIEHLVKGGIVVADSEAAAKLAAILEDARRRADAAGCDLV